MWRKRKGTARARAAAPGLMPEFVATERALSARVSAEAMERV
jgi:hypothetical protein